MKILVIDNNESNIAFFKEYLYQYDLFFSTTEGEALKALRTFEYAIIYINGSVKNYNTILEALKLINRNTKIFVHSEKSDTFTNKPFMALNPLGFCVLHKPIIK